MTKYTPYMVRIAPEQLDHMRRISERADVPVARLFRQAVDLWLKRYSEQTAQPYAKAHDFLTSPADPGPDGDYGLKGGEVDTTSAPTPEAIAEMSVSDAEFREAIESRKRASAEREKRGWDPEAMPPDMPDPVHRKVPARKLDVDPILKKKAKP